MRKPTCMDPTYSHIIAGADITGLAGGGKDTAAMARRRVTGPSSTNEHLTASALAGFEPCQNVVQRT